MERRDDIVPSVNSPLPEPPAVEKLLEAHRMARAGMARYEKKGDPNDREVLLRITNESSAFVEEMERRLGLVPDPDPDE